MPSSRRVITLLGVLLLALVSPLSAQGSEEVIISIGEEGIELKEAVDRASKDTGRAFLFGDSRGLSQKKIFLEGPHRVPREKLYEFWQSVFVTQGFAIIPMGPGSRPYLLLEAIDSSQRLIQRARYVSVEELAQLRRQAGAVVVTTLQLRNVSVDQVRSAVTPLLQNKKSEFIQAVPGANAILVAGFAPTVYAVQQLVVAMDVTPPGLLLRFEKLPLKHAEAAELQPILSDLITASKAAAGGGPDRSGGRGRPANLIPGQEAPEAKIIADPRSNSLILYATQNDIDQVRRLVADLDSPQRTVESNIRLYYVKHRNADDVADRLREIVGQQSSGRSTRTGRGGAARRGGQSSGGQSSFASGFDDLGIVAFMPTNCLVITCNSRIYEDLEPIIEQLDQRRPQVLVQALVLQLSDSDLRRIAVELTGVEGGSGYRVAGATAFGFAPISARNPESDEPTTTPEPGTGPGTGTGTGGGNPGSSDPSGTSETTDFLDTLTRVPFTGTSGFNGLTAGILQGDFNVPLLLAAQKTKNFGNLVSSPSVLANDNEASRFVVGVEVPIAETNQLAGEDGPVAGPTNFTYREANLEFAISPQIANDAYLSLSIELSIDTFVASQFSTPGSPPGVTTFQYDGVVTIPDGKTVVIGGLNENNSARNRAGIPYLMDLPFLGHLFRDDTQGEEIRNMYVFVTANIFRDFDALEKTSEDRIHQLAKLEGNVRLFAPEFDFELDGSENRLEDLNASGVLDLPGYQPLSPQGKGEKAPGKTMEPRSADQR